MIFYQQPINPMVGRSQRPFKETGNTWVVHDEGALPF